MIYKRLYKVSSGKEGGTLYQLRNLINRRNVVANPKKDFNACEDFFLLVVKCHILAAAMSHFGMSMLSDDPSCELVPDNIVHCTEDEKWLILSSNIKVILEAIRIQFPAQKYSAMFDGVNIYASEVLSLGLFYMEYKDAIHEGDGMRVLRCWKYLLPLFKANNHKNYAIEAANLLTQYHYIFPPRQAQQLLWSRFINATGKAGHNIPCDLHMEHLNRLCKSAIKMLGVNKTEKSIQRVGKCLRILKVVGERYDREMDISDTTGTHIKPSDTCDRDKILKELTERSNIFLLGANRQHALFKSVQKVVYSTLKEDEFHDWLSQYFFHFVSISMLNR